MADWFAKLMQRGRSRSRPGNEKLDAPRDPRYDSIVQMLRDRATEDRDAREKRQRGYRQSLEHDVAVGSATSSSSSPTRLHRFRTKVPCRVTPEARALLDQLRKRFSGCTVTFPQLTSRQQAVMVSGATHTERKQIGLVEHCVETDATLCNVRNHGLAVETDGGAMLVLRFRYPLTAVRMCSSQRTGTTDEAAFVDFTEIRPALDVRPSDGGSSPRLTWITRPEVATMQALGSRDYEAFYVRFKLEVQAGIWSSLSTLLSDSPASQWHRGSHYAVAREPDAANRKIYQRTVDDSGRVVDIGLDRIYDAAPATDILLLYLEGDILADFADIYFTLQSLGSADAYFLKEEFFTVVRRFWAGAQSLVSRYGSDLATIVRMCQRAVPMPAQAPLLKQDWTNLRQSVVDRYGARGWKAADLIGANVYRPRTGSAGWPFSSFPAGEVNVGLRIVYRQEWQLHAQRGEVIRRMLPAGSEAEGAPSIQTTFEQSSATRTLEEIVDDVVDGAVAAMKWPRDSDGSIHIGVRGLAATTDMGLASECREISRETSTRLSDIVMRKMATMARDEPAVRVSSDDCPGASCVAEIEGSMDEDAATIVHSQLQNRYEVLTRLAEVQNVVLVAEKLPSPAEIDVAWVRRHDWVLGKVLLDESFRDALDAIGQEAATAGRALEATRSRLCEHLRANILHYQRAIWQQEDPQQRCMRYRKLGKRVPLDWRFELESGDAMTIDQFGDRLTATSVDGQFAAYTAGREADLDQVIDPAGPIGYYGNYAVYHMRPEFGSGDLFSMLHFFKSPYLRPTPDTGAPEVEDPVQMEMSEDPAVAATLFRRERARRMVLDTDGLVIDVIRRADAAPANPEGREGVCEGSIDLGEAAARHQLLLERGRGIELLGANSQWDAGAEWTIIRADHEHMINMLTSLLGAGAHGHDPESESLGILSEEGRGMTALSPSPVRGLDTEPAILAPNDGVELTASAGKGAPEAQEAVIVRQGDGQVSDLNAGRAHGPETEPAIVAGNNGPRLTAIAGGGGVVARDAVIVRRSDRGRTPGLRAGRTHTVDDGRLVLARGEGAVRLTTVAGGGAPAHERAIVAGDEEVLRPGLVAE